MSMLRKMSMVVIGMMLAAGCVQQQRGRDAIYQTSTLNALMEGVYDGPVTFGELGKNGDFGIGTFNGLEGEMIELDRTFYQVKADGKVYPVSPATTTPFADVTWFKADRCGELMNVASLENLQKTLDVEIPSKNIFYAVKITGTFAYVKTRSIPKQNKPYPGLAAAAKHQSVFEFKNVRGTLVGYRMPGYVQGINMPGYHVHFITEDRKGGGHVLDCRIDQARLELDECYELRLVIPKEGDFSNADLNKNQLRELEKVEK